MLEVSLRECENFKKVIECLEKEIKELKTSSDDTNLRVELLSLKKEIEEKKKESKKKDEKYHKEIKELNNQKLQISESLRLAVLERENLKETDRILLNTLDIC